MNGQAWRSGRGTVRCIARALLVAVAVAAVASACSGPSPSRQFRTVLHYPEEVAPFPVALSDETGLVTWIEAAPADPQFDYSAPAARADPTDPNAFFIRWLGGACDNDALLWFTRGDGVYSLSIEVHGKFGFPGGCTMQGIFRDVRIVNSSPVPIDSIVAAGGK